MPQAFDEAASANPDTAVLVKLMRLQDGDLDETESRQIRSELQQDPELQALYADMERGTAAARLVLTSNASEPVSGQILPFRRSGLRTGMLPVFDRVDFKQAAAIAVLGIAVGLVGGHFVGRSSVSDDMLRPAGLNAAAGSGEDNVDLALQKALVPLLTESGRQRVDIDDQAAGLHGTVDIERHLQLASGIACAEISFTDRQSAKTTISGLACQDPSGDWQVMTMKTAH